MMKLFANLCGQRKPSKCEKLLRGAQCRLKLLKNKRRGIVKQLRGDVDRLLKHGNHQTAFQRIEQLFKDETMVEVYDHLDNFCEFLILNLPCNHKHKEIPDDVNEAISTLIFSSARLGDLPELIALRRLFGERYGQKFVNTALQLSPGNLVNHQIQESLCLTIVPNEVKYRLLNEIASSFVEQEGLLLQQKILDGTEAEGKIVYVDLASERMKLPEHHSTEPAKEQTYVNTKQNLSPGEGEKLVKPGEYTKIDEFLFSQDSDSPFGVGSITGDSTPENCARAPLETIYLDDIEETVSPVRENGDFEDQRIFLFKSPSVSVKDEIDYRTKTEYTPDEEQKLSPNDKSRRSRNTRKSRQKRPIRRLVSQENGNVRDVEGITCYSQADDEMSDNINEPYYQKRCTKNNSLIEKSLLSFGSPKGQNRSLITVEGRDEDFVNDGDKPDTGKIGQGLELCCRGEPENNGTGDEETTPAYSRAMSMPIERPRDESRLDNIDRSNSYPVEKPRSDGYSPCRHIHPNLPDYDALAARFAALKKEGLLKKHQAT